MLVLGIETSCDETAAAVVKDGKELLSNVVSSQIDIHIQYGGVVPEIAARSHIEAINPVINQALEKAKVTWADIDAIGVTKGAGLSGSLLIGVLAAKTLAIVHQKPLYGLNHVLGHLYANFLELDSSKPRVDPQPLGVAPQFPIIGLIVSGGHSQITLMEDHYNYRLLGKKQDDAVGEAFDKVAKVLGLPYPGGPSIDKAARGGDPLKYKLPVPKLDNPYDFSFSGLKTATLRLAQQVCGKDYTFPSFKLAELLDEQQVKDIAASFQYTAIKTLVKACQKACEEFAPKSFIIGGGVAASSELRRQLEEALPHLELNYPPMTHCTDNAAMMATLAHYHAQQHQSDDPYLLEVNPVLSM